MITAVAGAYGGVSGAGGESGNIFNALSEAMTALGLPADAGSTQPNAYLNFIFMDELGGFDLLNQQDDGGHKLIPAGSYQSKQRVAFDEPFVANTPGYLYIYLTFEEENTAYYVHFDDFKITYTPSRLVQVTDYYPFGASHSTSWTRETATPNPYLYNAGAEKNEKTGWYETYFRSYDAYTGRFNQVDPAADMFGGLSTYHYAYNSPVVYNDPLGLWGKKNKGGGNEKKKDHEDASSGGGGQDYGPPMTFPEFTDLFGSDWGASAYGSSQSGGAYFTRYGPGDGGALGALAGYMSAGAHAAAARRDGIN